MNHYEEWLNTVNEHLLWCDLDVELFTDEQVYRLYDVDISPSVAADFLADHFHENGGNFA